MDVTSSTSAAASLSAIVNSPQPQPQQPAPAAKTSEQNPPESTVVKLSAQAQQLNRAETQNTQNNGERNETQAKETAEPSGIQFMEGETKGGRISTFA
jgi:hypothetical protein